jgi:putative ribosome biogenesis GTPase RsgA
VLENIENGEILESRYQNYLKLVDEAEELEGK